VKVEAEVTSISGLGKLYCDHSACSVTLKAVLTGGATALPQGVKVVWSGDATFSNQKGLTVKASFKGHVGEKNRIKAKLTTQSKEVKSNEFVVVDHEPIKGVNTVTYSMVKVPVPAGKYGLTTYFVPEFNIGVYFDHSSHVWKSKIISSTNKIGQGAHLPLGPPRKIKEASVSAATAFNYSKMVGDLLALGTRQNTEWYMLAAVQAHETVHSDLWKMTNNMLFWTLKSQIEGLSVSYSSGCKDMFQAKRKIKSLAAYIEAKDQYEDEGEQALKTDLTHGKKRVDTACRVAEEGVVKPMATTIMTHAIAMGWHLLP
jgi:hypothetical protein